MFAVNHWRRNAGHRHNALKNHEPISLMRGSGLKECDMPLSIGSYRGAVHRRKSCITAPPQGDLAR